MRIELRESVSTKPLPLKQRTSSRDGRRDFSEQTWMSLLRLLKPREYFITVDNFSIWRRHLAWAMEDGSDLRGYISQRYASSMVFMSLLLGAALNVLFNSDYVTTQMRQNMRENNYLTISFWAGIIMLLSVVLTILSIISTFTAWGMVTAISDTNAQCILRSSIGQYVAELPGRFIVASVYSFLLWVILFCFLLLPVGILSFIVVFISLGLFLHVVVVFSAFGRIIMHTGAMGSTKIFEEDYERGLLPHGLHANLLAKATAQLSSNTSIMRQYRFPRKPLATSLSMESLASLQMNEKPLVSDPPPAARRRKSSSVRFADNFMSSPMPVTAESPLPGSRMPAVPKHERRGSGALKPPRPPPVKVPGTPSGSIGSPSPFNGDSSVASIEEWLQGSPFPSQGEAFHASESKISSPTVADGGTATKNEAFIDTTATGSMAESSNPPGLNLSGQRPRQVTSRTRTASSGTDPNLGTSIQQSSHSIPSRGPSSEGATPGRNSWKRRNNRADGTRRAGNVETNLFEGRQTQIPVPQLSSGASLVRPLSSVNTSRTSSVVSSIGDPPDIGMNLSDDDKFYEEYGHLFDPETGVVHEGEESQASDAQHYERHALSPTENIVSGLNGSAPSEKHPLLRNSDFQHSRYDTASRD